MVSSKAISVFIDASNTWEVQKAKGKFLSWEKFSTFLKKEYSSEKISFYYYSAYPTDKTRNYSLEGRHKFYTYLKKGLGFTVRKKPLKRIIKQTPEGEIVEEKGNMDVEMTIDAVHYKSNFGIAIFFSGDSDFLALMSYLRRGGKKVFVYSSKNNVSTELRTGADGYIDILEIDADIWGKELVHRESLEK